MSSGQPSSTSTCPTLNRQRTCSQSDPHCLQDMPTGRLAAVVIKLSSTTRTATTTRGVWLLSHSVPLVLIQHAQQRQCLLCLIAGHDLSSPTLGHTAPPPNRNAGTMTSNTGATNGNAWNMRCGDSSIQQNVILWAMTAGDTTAAHVQLDQSQEYIVTLNYKRHSSRSGPRRRLARATTFFQVGRR